METSWEFIYKGNLIAIEKHKTKGFERAVRPPGVRLILKNKENKFLLTKEFRHEQNKYDYRLPGGKVFDELESYLALRGNQEKLDNAVYTAARIEAKQEVGADEIQNLTIVSKSVAGASVEWDLYYLSGEIDVLGKQELDGDEKEHGIEIGFYTKEEIITKLTNGEISEDRTVGVLFRYLSSI